MHCQVRRRRDGTSCYAHFMQRAEVVRLYDPVAPVFSALVEELPGEEPGCYWAWWDNQRGEFRHVYPDKKLFEIVFPYGSAAEEERGKGSKLPVRVTPGDVVPPCERRQSEKSDLHEATSTGE